MGLATKLSERKAKQIRAMQTIDAASSKDLKWLKNYEAKQLNKNKK